MPRRPVCDHPKRHAARVVVCHLGRYARIVAALVRKAGFGLDVARTAVAAARVYDVARGDDFYRALHPGDVTLFCLCYGKAARAAPGAGIRGVLLELCGSWLVGASLVAPLAPARLAATGNVPASFLIPAGFCGFIIDILFVILPLCVGPSRSPFLRQQGVVVAVPHQPAL